jgi:hypothetical protein
MSDCPIHGVRGGWCTSDCIELAVELRRSHVCAEQSYVASSDGPRPNGDVAVTLKCSVCGRTLARGTDRVL